MADDPEGPGQTILPEHSVTPLALPDGTPVYDKGFSTEGGNKMRVRLVRVDDVVSNAPIPTGANVPIAAHGYTLSLTAALLNDDLTVAKDVTGAYVITDRHEILINDEAMQNPAFDIQAEIDQIIRQEAYRFDSRIKQRAATTDYLHSTWGGSLLPTAPGPAYTSPPQQTVGDVTNPLQPEIDHLNTVAEQIATDRAAEVAAAEKAKSDREMTAADIGVPEAAAS